MKKYFSATKKPCIDGPTRYLYIAVMATKQIETVGDLVDALGGPTKAAEALRAKSPQTIVNWRNTGAIPAKFYRLHRDILTKLEMPVSDKLWGFVDEAAA